MSSIVTRQRRRNDHVDLFAAPAGSLRADLAVWPAEPVRGTRLRPVRAISAVLPLDAVWPAERRADHAHDSADHPSAGQCSAVHLDRTVPVCSGRAADRPDSEPADTALRTVRVFRAALRPIWPAPAAPAVPDGVVVAGSVRSRQSLP